MRINIPGLTKTRRSTQTGGLICDAPRINKQVVRRKGRKKTSLPETEMSRCPHCNEILSDDWIKRQGASLMGKKGGVAKARSLEATRAAALKRWAKNPVYKTEEERIAARKKQQREAHKRWRDRHPERWKQLQANAKARRDYKILCAELIIEAALLGEEK